MIARYRYIQSPDHPLATGKGSVAEHRLVLYEKIGPGPHPCHWCQAPVDWLPGERTAAGALTADHVDNDSRNNAPENLVPSCHRCNSIRQLEDLVSDDELWITMTGNRGRHRAVERFCEQCGARFLALAAEKRPNRGRFCSRGCARRRS